MPEPTPTPEPDDDRARLAGLLADCKGDPDLFNAALLGRPPYWRRQREVVESVVRYPATLVPAGNMVGKTFAAAGLLHWFLLTNAASLVLATAPSQTQLEEVLWKEVERSYRGARIPLGGRLLKSPLKIDLGGGWQALAYSTTKTERLSGHHAGAMLAILDEASGVEPPIWEAIDSCDPSRLLATGNPLRPDGQFYERCTSAVATQDDPHRLANLIAIPSTDSPHIDLPRSPWGLANATWLAKARNDYGEGSLWWICHVLGRFPDSASDSVLSREWIDLAARTVHLKAGPRRTAIDLGEGSGGDRSVVLTRDDDGLLDWRASNRWSFEDTAAEAARQSKAWGVEPHRVTWDVGGPGADFNNRLQSAGIVGARPYRGGSGTFKKYGNLRSKSAWALRQRLDPGFMARTPAGLMVPLAPFSLRPDFVTAARDELQGLRYSLDAKGRICLEEKKLFVLRLKKSPDLADALAQSFAFPE